jgi:hypothetical protein
MVHRERAYDQVERGIVERQRRDVADNESRLSRPGIADGVRLSPLDHPRIEVKAGHVEVVIASQADR